MKSTSMITTPATGLSSSAVRERSCAVTALLPDAAAHGTGLSFAGTAAAQVAVLGARSTDLPGSVPRGAPV